MGNMTDEERFNMVMTTTDRELLEALAEYEDRRSLSEVVRILIRREAKARGLKVKAEPQPEQVR